MAKLPTIADDLFGLDPFGADAAPPTSQCGPIDEDPIANEPDEHSKPASTPTAASGPRPRPGPGSETEPEPEPKRIPTDDDLAPSLSFAGSSFPATTRILGRDLDGSFECVSFGQTFKTLPSIDALDLSSRLFDSPKTRITPIVGYFDRSGDVVILNLSEVVAKIQAMPIHPKDTFWVFIIRQREAIQALKIGLEPHYLAVHGREADDPRAFLRLCLASGSSTDTTCLDEARIFRGWCGPTAKPYALKELMSRFGFSEKRYSKLRELIRKEGLTHQPSGKAQRTEGKTEGPKLEIQQKRLRAFLTAQHFRTANFFWAEAVTQANEAMKETNKSLPNEWAIMCALLASCKKRIKDPSKQLQELLDPSHSIIDALRAFISQLTKEHDLPLFDSTAHNRAQALLQSVTEGNDV